MAKNRPNSTSSPREETYGYRPYRGGYQPTTAETSQGKPLTQELPKPPTGGTGQSSPKATRPKEGETHPE